MKYTLVAWMRDKPGVLNRVSGMLRRRNFNIDSLQVSHSETPGISRMTFVVDGDERVVDQVVKQMHKVIDVTRVEDISEQPTILRELALLRVRTTTETRAEIMQFSEIYRAQIVDVSPDSLVVQIVGSEEKVDSLIELLDRFGIEDMVRTGRVALRRGTREGNRQTASSVWKARSTPITNGNRSEREKTGGV
ncbi:MAG: acetolactate synthase small subunit [Chloroflexi bacterium]|nr:MAG: acetolactate synthase small subunit [Chloroflexota bacterium]